MPVLENQKIKHLQTRSQLMALQSKINPHFLFNTLNTMLNLVYKSPEKVENMILNLSDIYRRVLRLLNNEGISIKEEANIIREYLEIEKIRMGSRLDFTLSLDPERFCRVHKSTIVSLDKIRHLKKWFKSQYIIQMNDEKKSKLKMSCNYMPLIKQKLNF